MSVIPIFIPLQQFPFYIKKKELEDYISKRKKQAKTGSSIFFVALMLCQMMLALMVLPKLILASKDVGIQPPSYSMPTILVFLLLGIIFLAIVLSLPPLDEEKVKKLNEDNSEMVTINSNIMNPKIVSLVWIYALAFMITLIVSIILPVVTMTSSV